MPVAIITIKILACILMAVRVYSFIKIKLEDKSVNYRFELMSLIEHAAGYGVFLVSVLSVINENTYIFTLGLNIVNLLIVYSHNSRIVVAGDNKILLKLKIYDKKKIRGINASSFALHVIEKNGNEIKVIAPLTHNESFNNLKYVKK